MNGWIKVHRSLIDHWIFAFDGSDKALAWIDLIMMARHDYGEILLKNRVQKVKKGQIAMSQISLQKRWNWSQNKVKRFLKLLKNERMIDFETNDLTTIITICNYSSFQDHRYEDERPVERRNERPVERTTNDQSNDDIRKKEGKERKNNYSQRKNFSEDDMDISLFIWGSVEQMTDGQKKPNLDNWANTIRLMRERDNREVEEIKSVFFWAHNDSFWRTNIRSPEKLRKQYDNLKVKMNSERNKQNSKVGSRSNHGPVTIDHNDTSWDIAEY